MNQVVRVGTLSLTLGLLSACGSAPTPAKAPGVELACRQDVLDPRELEGAPPWVTNCTDFPGATAGVLCAVGKSREPSQTLAQGVATAMARRELAASLRAQLRSELSLREQSDAAAGQATRGSQASQSVEEVVEGTVVGSNSRGVWISRCGTLHALVVLEPSVVENAKAQLAAP